MIRNNLNKKNKTLKFISFFLIIFFTSGCADIEYPTNQDPQNSEPTTTTTEDLSVYEDDIVVLESGFEENALKNFNIKRDTFLEKKQFEEIYPNDYHNALFGYESNGYIQIEPGESISFEIDLPTNQHYRLGLCVCTHKTILLVTVNGVDIGTYNIADAFSFAQFSLDGIYMESGKNTIQITSLSGIAYLDFYTLSDTAPVPELRYEVSRLLINKNADNNALLLMDYLGGVFGKKTLTAQHCTPNSDAELNAVYAVTDRYPAIRSGDLGKYSRNYTGSDKNLNHELELATAWAEKGGIISFCWSWYEPLTSGDVSFIYSSQATFELNKAFTVTDLSSFDPDKLRDMFEAEQISEECYNLVLDIDDMAENLKILRDKGIPVLWRPLMEAGLGWYWWGDCDPNAYIWLWKLMVDRMSNYHELSNLIWVWNGEDYDFYPGDDYVDIIGEDVYNMSDTSNLPRFNAASRYGIRRKMTAMTECGLVPDPDILGRDNALWLWFGLYKGDYIVADNGLYFSEINTKKKLSHTYNHELTITLDELPLIF